MKPACVNHPEKISVVRGLCQACYMRERRAEQRRIAGYMPAVKLSVGETTAALLRVWNADMASRVNAKIDRSAGVDACHIWDGTKTKQGYGMITLGGHNVLVHRLAHALATGDTASAVVMHKCDNPSCVNPKHLRGGTHQENSDDMKAKGRTATGHRHGCHLRQRDMHPRSKRVQTPFGEYPSATLAAEALGMHIRAVSRLCMVGKELGGWHRKEDDTDKPGWTYLD